MVRSAAQAPPLDRSSTCEGPVLSGSETSEVTEMPDKAEPMNNSERLLAHLEDSSLAARLVRAHRDRDPAHPAESIKAVLKEGLEQVRASIDDAED